MSQFRVGDIVECVDLSNYAGLPIQSGLTIGGLYTVTGFGQTGRWRLGATQPSLHLREAPSPDGWRIWRFRKIHRPRAEFLTELLTAPVDIPAEREDA